MNIELRDEFAKAALAIPDIHAKPGASIEQVVEARAVLAYLQADAMLAERGKSTGEDPYASVREYAEWLKKQAEQPFNTVSEDRAYKKAIESLKGFTGIEPEGGS